ncbi:AarF/ABC1/UbiB kinase family protein [Bdellovibrio sp. KM01]|uniref:ABC1 kinase family protein n=1 Tax=Bdellovibrio sp. KM01 TaxID=2748865 RepID=UPI0015EA8A3C|nr:AarF/ABC1/UbiB kinase family protein [Bdellovibrio sp. KM01]QLY26997.1 AarF/ABC1/UbiB kinase family protein [Bdellovibrio sp. KM01]
MDEKKSAKKQNNDAQASKKEDLGLHKIKSSVFSRGLSIAKLTLQTGASVAQHGVTTVLKSKEFKEANWKKLLETQASNISTELGQLKGSLMKAGQMLSMYGEHFLPPEANEFLKSLQSDSPSLNWAAIEKRLKELLPPEKLAQLEIEKEALASASMGQVHRAKIKATGELIVLKIQYPNVDKAIDSDLRAIKTLLSTLKLIPKDFNTDSLFAEIREMLLQETDYLQEADATEDYHRRLEGDKRFVVPKVFREFSGPKILATSFERGLRADDPVIQSLPQERRNRLATNFLDLYFKEIFEWGVVQTDPHSGNYRIRIDPQGHDQLILLDFGATRVYDASFLIPYRQMVKGSLFNHRDMFTEAALKLGFIKEGDSAELKSVFEAFCFETVEPFIEFNDPRNTLGVIDQQGNYDWKNTDLPQRLSKKVFQIARQFSFRTPPREIIFLDRKTGGVFIFLSILKAKMRGRDLLLKYLNKMD